MKKTINHSIDNGADIEKCCRCGAVLVEAHKGDSGCLDTLFGLRNYNTFSLKVCPICFPKKIYKLRRLQDRFLSHPDIKEFIRQNGNNAILFYGANVTADNLRKYVAPVAEWSMRNHLRMVRSLGASTTPTTNQA